MTQSRLRAVILDMDGLLIDTEPVWRVAQAEVFAGLGVQLTEQELLDSTGQPTEDLIPLWRQRAPAGDRGLSDARVADQITDRIIAHVKAEGEPMPGVTDAIALFRRHGLALAIASSSPRRLIDAVCDRLGLRDIDVRCSGAEEAHGKPAPDVYLTAARRLGRLAAECLAIEDSPNGVLAAKSAGMRCVAVPDPLLSADPRFDTADLVLDSLTAFDQTVLRRLGMP